MSKVPKKSSTSLLSVIVAVSTGCCLDLPPQQPPAGFGVGCCSVGVGDGSIDGCDCCGVVMVVDDVVGDVVGDDC